jgi:C-terminal processing protease CtpA/Prc
VEELTESNTWTQVLGPETVGIEVTIDVLDTDGTPRQVTLTKDWVTYQTVPVATALDSAQGKVGYLVVNRFLGTTEAELRNAFAILRAEAVSDLVLDLRYNPGGLNDTAALLGSLIAGEARAGQRFMLAEYNANYQIMNSEIQFTNEPGSLALDRIVVITSVATASASELVINGLLPFLEVGLVGERTGGKPVGSLTWEFCDQALTPVTFRMVNADGDGDYYEGFAPNCAAVDDLLKPLGDPSEARLAAALSWLQSGVCPP